MQVVIRPRSRAAGWRAAPVLAPVPLISRSVARPPAAPPGLCPKRLQSNSFSAGELMTHTRERSQATL